MPRAILVDPTVPGCLALGDTELRPAAPNEAVVRVRATSLNRGEVRAAQGAPAGTRLGWDVAGVVETAAVNGTGPAAGTRVVGLLRAEAWAELAVVPVANLATLPDEVSFEQAATLPVAGLTALYALDRAPGLVGRSVLVAGASGGVGHHAVQIAVAAGAEVTGLVRQEAHAALIRDTGAAHVVVDGGGAAAAEFAPYDVVLDGVGGDVWAAALGMMAYRGTIVTYGGGMGASAVPFDAVALLGKQLTASGLIVFEETLRETAAAGLQRLVRLAASGRLTPLISLQADWTDIGSVTQQLLDRGFPGKAVLTLS
jgi:NADPH:quinone reductase-like Zn-dependent oxidoreductase